jgi:hypothetical protein
MPTATSTPTPTVTILKLKDGKVVDTILYYNTVKRVSFDYRDKSIAISPSGVRVIRSNVNDKTLYISFTDAPQVGIPIDDYDYNYDITIHFPNLVAVVIVNNDTVNVGATTP